MSSNNNMRVSKNHPQTAGSIVSEEYKIDVKFD